MGEGEGEGSPFGGRAGGLEEGRGGGVGDTRLRRDELETELAAEALRCCADRSICLNASTCVGTGMGIFCSNCGADPPREGGADPTCDESAAAARDVGGGGPGCCCCCVVGVGGDGVATDVVGEGELDPPPVAREMREVLLSMVGVCGLPAVCCDGCEDAAASISLEPILRTGVLPPIPPAPVPGAVPDDRGRCCCDEG